MYARKTFFKFKLMMFEIENDIFSLDVILSNKNHILYVIFK